MTQRATLGFFCSFMLLMGLGQLLLLPPFEGIDEIGHYSLIAQVAQTGEFPFDRKAMIAQEIEDYRTAAPMPYPVIEAEARPSDFTYASFFEKPDLVAGYREKFREPTFKGAERSFYHPTDTLNWQIQHPPLYYIIMGPLLRLVSDLPFVDRFFVLRFVSFLLAVSGFCIGLAATFRHTQPHLRKYLSLAVLIYPVILPQVIPEFARLGNDSLCALIFGVFWALVLEVINKKESVRLYAAIGLTLCAGLLTKGLFIPAAAGWGLFTFGRLWMLRNDHLLLRKSLLGLLSASLPILLGLGWYLYSYLMTGAMIGHYEYELIEKQGGVLAQFGHNITVKSVIYAFLNVLFTWSWASSASLGRLHELFTFPIVLIPLWILARAWKHNSLQAFKGNPLLSNVLLGSMALGLIHHCFVVLSLDPRGATPGWYFHVLLPAFMPLMVLGLELIHGSVLACRLLKFLLVFSVGFGAVVIWSGMALVAGCATLGFDKMLVFSDGIFCFSRSKTIFDNLDVIVWPEAGMIFVLLAFVVYLASLVKVFAALRR